jgi:nitroreductase
MVYQVYTFLAVEFEEAVRTRRTHKVYGAEPVDQATLAELFELARWAPNHHLTSPWRFRVLGPEARERLKACAGPEATKLDRAPTLVVASVVQTGDPQQDEEDLCAAACAIYIVLLGAHARGLANYWRTPGVLRTAAGCAAVGLEENERFLGLIHLGPKRQEQPPPARPDPDEFVTYLP